MEERDKPLDGFHLTLAVSSRFEDPRVALPVLGSALAESGPVRRETLNFLLAAKGLDAAELIVRGFSSLNAEDRALALTDRERLVRAATRLLATPDPDLRLGPVTFASALPPGDGLDILLPLVDDPADGVRRIARRALVAIAKEFAAGRGAMDGPAELRKLLTASTLALRSPGVKAASEEAESLVAAIIRAAGSSPEARSPLRAFVDSGPAPAREAVLRALESSHDPAVASILLSFIASGPAPVRESAVSILRFRRDPEFLRSLAKRTAERMQSSAGIPAATFAALAHVAWEDLPVSDLRAIPATAQKRLLAVTRMFRGDPAIRARRLATFLASQDRKIRELTLDALRDSPPHLYRQGLAGLLDDSAEELQLRAVELLTRAGTFECRQILIDKSREPGAAERLGRHLAAHGIGSNLPAAARQATRAQPAAGLWQIRAPESVPIQEFPFPVLRPLPPAARRGPR